MIKNAREYQITKAQATKFERALAALPSSDDEAGLLEREALKSQLADLRAELNEYDALESGHRKVIEVEDLSELPRALIQARISAGLSQRQLAERLGLREQQVQRYEATEYASANLARIQQIVQALGIQLRQDVVLPSADLSIDAIVGELKAWGFDRDFVESRLVLDRDTQGGAPAWRTANAITRVLGLPQGQVFATGSQVESAAPLYKRPASANEMRLRAYTVYARYLSARVLSCVDTHEIEVPRHPAEFRKNLVTTYGGVSFESVLRYVWDLGIAVLPLRDRGAFHGAMWRLAGRPVIVLKQHVFSNARWLIDLLHEVRHVIQTVGQQEAVVIESADIADSSRARLPNDLEHEATEWASAVVLDGRGQSLAEACVAEAAREIPALKAAVERVATREGVSVAALANYVAYRVAREGQDWWGAATNMQPRDENPWATARDVLLERLDIHRLDATDRELLSKALYEEE